MEIRNASKSQARSIARLIMQAMSDDCCRHFMGPGYELSDFEEVMTSLVCREKSQYSYLNTLVALDADGQPCGICVSYDGARLQELRQAFVDAMRVHFGRDFSRIDDETAAGELYVDSLAVREDARGKGIATALLHAVMDKAKSLGVAHVGLLVDKDNPRAQRLYARVGFEYVNDTAWGGHPMLHLQYRSGSSGRTVRKA